jgi:hypothetical protein
MKLTVKNDGFFLVCDFTIDCLEEDHVASRLKDLTAKAPIAENLAAELIMLKPWKKAPSFPENPL